MTTVFFEYAVMEYPFAFWQWGDSCQNIPDKNTSLQDAVEYFVSRNPLKLFADHQIKYYLIKASRTKSSGTGIASFC